MTQKPLPTPSLPCSACGYDLRHAPEDTCPECGSSLPRRKAVARRRAGLRRFFIILILAPLVGPVIAFIGLYLWFMPPNVGLPVGYWGNYNRVHREIRALPNVEVKDVWLHRDTTLEDFGFKLIVDEHWSVDFEVTGGHDCRNVAEIIINGKRLVFDEPPLTDMTPPPTTAIEVLERITEVMAHAEIPPRPPDGRTMWAAAVQRPWVFVLVEPAD